MQRLLETFPLSMAGVILIGISAIILLAGKEALRLQAHRWQALAGVIGMTFVLVLTTASLILTSLLSPQKGGMKSQWSEPI